MRASIGISLVFAMVVSATASIQPPAESQGKGKPPARPAGAKAPVKVNLSNAYNAYINRLRGKVLNNWSYPDGKNRVVLQVVVQPDGTAGDISLSSTPKNDQAEQAANAAFAQAQPLEALPTNSPAAKVTLTFESFSDPHGDSSSNLSGRLDPVSQ